VAISKKRDDVRARGKYGGHAVGDEPRDFAKDMVLLEQSGANPVSYMAEVQLARC
jgi:hypothetical protein